MLIAKMKDQHLLRTIALFGNTMVTVASSAGGLETLKMRLSGRKLMSINDAVSAIDSALAHLIPYIYEAVLRGLDLKPFSAQLAAVFGRDSVLPAEAGFRLLDDGPDEAFFQDVIAEDGL